jgi:MFS transporter, SP family, solute carrier family 2 (myo-inositol transporter), member 13
MASYATGTGNLAWHGSELFPLELRGMGSSLMTASCWSMNIIVSATFLSMLSGITAAGTFGFYAGMCCVCFSIMIS